MSTVGDYLQSLPPDRRVAMAKICSLIRRSARGVRESMRHALAFYELQGPLFALESGEKSMTLYVAEESVLEAFKDKLQLRLRYAGPVVFHPYGACLPVMVVFKRDAYGAALVSVFEGVVYQVVKHDAYFLGVTPCHHPLVRLLEDEGYVALIGKDLEFAHEHLNHSVDVNV